MTCLPGDLDVGALLPGERHHIGGEWVPGRGGETIDVINPATQDVLLRVPRGGPEDVDAAVQAAAGAFPAWRDTSPMVRADLLYRWAELIDEHGHELDLIERMEVGRPHWGPSRLPRMIIYLAGMVDKICGKSPQIVLRDADLAKAVPAIVRSITLNTGQVCAAGSRLLTPPELRDELVGAISDAFTKVRIGPWYEDVQMGPLISAKQERRVLGYLDIGREEGAEIVTGGHKLAGDPFDKGFFVEPTLFDRVRPDMRIAQEEIFGPVLSVIGYTDEDEALAIANGTRYGLTASVWTRDMGRAVRIAKNIAAGHVYVNTPGAFGVIGAPWDGTKGSGFGRPMSPDIVEEYTQVKTVVIDGDA